MRMLAYMSLTIITFSLASIGYCVKKQSDVGEAPREDLAGCKLPHGITELPEQGSPKSIELKGYIFSFETGRLAIDPFTFADKHPSSFKEFRDAIIASKTGDIYFKSVGKEMFLFALSGRIKDLGQHFLYEFSGVELAEPTEVFFVEDNEAIPGVQPDVRLGNCYLITTVNGQLVLLRVIRIDVDRRSCAIQWIKRAPGAKVFEIPKGTIVEPKRRARELPVPALKGEEYWKRIEKIEKAVIAHVAYRKKLTKHLMGILEGGMEKGGHAIPLSINTLGEMRAVEAAPLLASMIDTPISSGVSLSLTIDNMFACVPALVSIGKPGAAACMDEIVKLTPEDRQKPFKEKLLCSVILRVEGEKVARLLLEERKEAVSKEKEQVENLDRAIALIEEVKSWGD